MPTVTPTPQISQMTYTYDGDGRMVKSVLGDVTTYYVGAHYEKKVRGGQQNERKYYFAGANLIAMRENGTLTWLLSDHLGSTSVVADANGNLLSSLHYTAFGEVRAASGNTSTDYRYTGQRRDSYINLYWFGSRWYDPALARFLSPDPIIPEPNNLLAYDRYQYVYSNPLRYTDSSGHCIDGISTWVCIAVLFKAVDYGWTAYDTYQSGRVLANPNASREDKMFAGLNVGLAIFLEAAEPDDFLPAGLPADDIARKAMMKGVREAFEEGGEEAVEKYIRNTLGDHADNVLNKMGINNFANPKLLEDHFNTHGAEFGYKSADDYLRGARELTSGGNGIETFTRSNGDKLFYNPSTNEFGVLTKNGVIRTYYKPKEGIDYWRKQIGK